MLHNMGVLVGLFHWMKWIYRDGRTYDNPAAVVEHVKQLLDRAQVLDG